MDLEKGTHCKYQIRYHIVWRVKYGREVLYGEREKYLTSVFQRIAQNYDYSLEAVGADIDHVHLFIGAHPAIAPAKLIQVLKSISAREMFKRYPILKQFLWGGALWSIGYYIRTVSDGPLEQVIRAYVKTQQKKTSKGYQLRLVPLVTTTELAP